LALYSWLIRPVLAYLDPVRAPAASLPFWGFLRESYFREEAVFGAGPLWFIETLLIFSLVYVLWGSLNRARVAHPVEATRFPGHLAITLFALVIGLAGFVVRVWLPAGWNFVPLNLQFPFFVQYIALFVVGLIAYRNDWLLKLPDSMGRLWLAIAGLLILMFWILIWAGGAIENGLDAFRGGLHWQALAYAVWESFVCVGMCLGLIYAFRRYTDRQGWLTAFLSRNAYTAYLIHEVVIIALAYSVRDVALYPLLKWAVVSLVAVLLCFGLSDLIRRLPYAERVL
jgi:surface polysaccharide O-acyltransferase-like enzyme